MGLRVSSHIQVIIIWVKEMKRMGGRREVGGGRKMRVKQAESERNTEKASE